MQLSLLLCLCLVHFSKTAIAGTLSVKNGLLRVEASPIGDSVQFTVDAPASIGWVAIGLNKNRNMDGADAMGKMVLSDRHNVGYDSVLDSKNDLTPIGVTKVGDRVKFQFKRLMAASDPQDQAIQLNAKQNWLFAWHTSKKPNSDSPSANVPEHDGYYNPVAFNFLASGQVAPNTNGMDSDKTIIAHGAMMFVAWAGLIPISTAIAKHAHHWGVLWFRLHVSLNSLAAVLMLVAFIIMVVMQGAEFDNAHSMLGLLVLIGTILLQIPLGVYIDRTWSANRQYIPYRDQFHWYLGSTLSIGALVVVMTGVYQYNASTAIIALSYVWVLCVFIGGAILQAKFGERIPVKGAARTNELGSEEHLPMDGMNNPKPPMRSSSRI